MNYSEPRIVLTESLEKRSYITFQINGKRVREYTGLSIGVQLSPNRATTIAERNYLIEVLRNHFLEALQEGAYELPIPKPKSPEDKKPMIGELEYTLKLALQSKRAQNLSAKYIRNLEKLASDFMSFLNEKDRVANITKLSSSKVSEFLQQYNNSATYYMTKRRHFKVLMAEAEKVSRLIIPAIKSIPRQKPKPKAHIPYTPEQLSNVFRHLRLYDEPLYTCVLLCYGCWLRPHNEIRRLTARNIKEDAKRIVLDADQNKSGRVRSVLVPEEVRVVLLKRLENLSPYDNLFTRTEEEFNEDYFAKKWQRARAKMLTLNLIEVGHTIYSFRHTAAIDLYRRTRDVSLLQRIMGHVEVTTTMAYLRGLGELNEQDWELGMPTFYK